MSFGSNFDTATPAFDSAIPEVLDAYRLEKQCRGDGTYTPHAVQKYNVYFTRHPDATQHRQPTAPPTAKALKYPMISGAGSTLNSHRCEQQGCYKAYSRGSTRPILTQPPHHLLLLPLPSLHSCQHLRESNISASFFIVMVNLHKNAEKWRVAAELQLRVLLKHAEAEGVDVVHGNLKLSRSGHLRYFSATATTGQYCKLHQEVESVATSRPANSCTAHFRYDNKHMVQFSQIDRVAVLLPGWGGGIGMYACALPSLVREFDVVYCIDLPGMGLSSRDTFPGMAADVSKSTRFFSTRLEAGLAELQRRDARFARARHRVLGAHSLGGYIAVEWMLTKRIAVQLFCRLVLIAPAGVMGAPRNPTSRIMPHTHPLLAPLTDALWNKGVTPMSLIKRLPETLARTASRTFISQRLGRDMRPEQRTALLEYLFQLGRAPTSAERAMCTLLHPGTWGRVPLIERLQLLTIPTAFVQGERDWMCSGVSEAAVEVMNAPYALKAVPRSGHNVFLDNPAGFTQVFAAVCDGLENFENLSPCTTLQHHERPQ